MHICHDSHVHAPTWEALKHITTASIAMNDYRMCRAALCVRPLFT